MRCVLSIDGGGVRGIIPALVLARLEAHTGRPVCRCFDLMAGTSTGGILALGLTRPEPAGRGPAFAAEDLVWLYEEWGRHIFERSLSQAVSSVAGLADERYSAEALERVLRIYFEGARMHQALTRVMVTAYDLEARRPFFFKSWERPGNTPGVAMAAAARATSAAPTYFEPARVWCDGVYRALIDGGVFANNPGACAYAEARRLWPDEDLMVVSLGTGERTEPIPYDEARTWGLVAWARPLLGVIFDGASDAVDYQLRHCLGAGYFRIQGRLHVARDAMDDASPAQIEALKTEARRIMDRHQGDLAVVADVLRARDKEDVSWSSGS